MTEWSEMVGHNLQLLQIPNGSVCSQHPVARAHMDSATVPCFCQRAESCIANLQQLNPNVTITANTSSVSSTVASNPAFFTQFRAICMVNQSMEDQIAVNNLLRQSSSSSSSSSTTSPSNSSTTVASSIPAFFTGECFGLYAYFFEDLQYHTYTHTKTRKDARGLDEEVVTTETKHYPRSLAELYDMSTLKYSALAKSFGRKKQEKLALEVWLGLKTLLHWRHQQHAASLSSANPPSDTVATYPTLTDSATAALYLQRENIAEQLDIPSTVLPQTTLLRMARMAGHELSPICAVVGGILGQEILKVLSGKDEPLSNTFVYGGEEGFGLMKDL